MSNSGMYLFPAVISDSVVGTSAGGCSEAACVQLRKFKLQTVFFYLCAKTFSVALIMGTAYYIFIKYTNIQIPLFTNWFHGNCHASVTRN